MQSITLSLSQQHFDDLLELLRSSDNECYTHIHDTILGSLDASPPSDATQLEHLLAQINTCEEEITGLNEKRSSLVHRIQSLKSNVVSTWKRFTDNGDHIIAIEGRYWWCNNGNLLDRVSQEDHAAITELSKHGIITKEIATRSLSSPL